LQVVVAHRALTVDVLRSVRSLTVIVKTPLRYATEAEIWSPGRTENTCVMWLEGSISHHAVYTGVVPEQYASTPACSTVLSYQPSRPTQKTAASGTVVLRQTTAGTFQLAATFVSAVRGATT
jgi:hypothetical protein